MKIKHLDITEEQKKEIDKETAEARNQEYNDESLHNCKRGKYFEDYYKEELKIWKRKLRQ